MLSQIFRNFERAVRIEVKCGGGNIIRIEVKCVGGGVTLFFRKCRVRLNVVKNVFYYSIVSDV